MITELQGVGVGRFTLHIYGQGVGRVYQVDLLARLTQLHQHLPRYFRSWKSTFMTHQVWSIVYGGVGDHVTDVDLHTLPNELEKFIGSGNFVKTLREFLQI